MDFRVRSYIAKCADAVRERFDISIPVQNIDEIVEKLNGSIVEAHEYDFEKMVIKSQDNKGFILHVLSGQSAESRTYSIVQALGHLFLHMGYMCDQELWDSYDFSKKRQALVQMEYEEDEFATCFLMPQKSYFDFVYYNSPDGEIDTFLISKHFGVPNGVAVNRGKWLGALQW